MKEIFTNIVNNGNWRANNTVCGNGSTMVYTDYLRKELGPFLERYNIKSMFDAPCGDYGWMSETKLPDGLQYIGGDIVDSLIEKNRQQHPTVDFRVFDISQDAFPEVDLLFCRDCLIHFSHADIRRVFENIARSNIKYVLMSSYPKLNNTDIQTGGFRGINFNKDPYDFEPAMDSIEDWIPRFEPRAMCLWSRETIIDYLKK
jgi:hypothetical protein